MKRNVVWSLGLVAFLGLGMFVSLYCINEGVPFVEGSKAFTEATPYGFSIGSTKEHCLTVIHENYSSEGRRVRVQWPKGSEIGLTLTPYENTSWATYPHRNMGEYVEAVDKLNALTPPLRLTERWEVLLPGGWVNNIVLTFRGDTLIEVRRSRWL